jgi:opacity protein-like surface antigen
MPVAKFAAALAGAALCSLSMSVQSRAADLPSTAPQLAPVPVFTQWEFSASVYVWALGVRGDLATIPPLPVISVDASFGDILQNLSGALMGTFEVKYGRFILFNDLMYTRVEPDAARSRGPVSVAVNVQSTSLIGLASVGYRVIEGPRFSMDLFAGVRGFRMDNELTVRATVGPFEANRKFGKTNSWLDAVGGMRMRYAFDDRWFATAIGFAGGGASKYQWDVYAGVGYAFNRNWAAFAGYRGFKVNYQDNGFIYDVLQHGPLVGLQFRW